MNRDPNKLRVFGMADDLAVEAYQQTRVFPPDETYGLRLQIRRAAASVPANIVEGSARLSRSEYVHFLGIALGSASEARYFIGLAGRLRLLEPSVADRLQSRYDHVIRALAACIRTLKATASRPKQAP